MHYQSNTRCFKNKNFPLSQKLRKTLPKPPCSKDTEKFPKKIKFQFFYITDDEYLRVCELLIKNQNCYATHRNDKNGIGTQFRIHLKPKARMQTQRPTKNPIHYC